MRRAKGRKKGAKPVHAMEDAYATDACWEGPYDERPCLDRLPQMKHELTIGEVARRSGVAVSAVRFYEAKGLKNPFINGDFRIVGGDTRLLTNDDLVEIDLPRGAILIGERVRNGNGMDLLERD